MKELLIKKIERTHTLFLDLLENLTQEDLSSKLANLPSNTIGQQYWCVIGARKSYLEAIIKGSWQGFSCPLEWEKTNDSEVVKETLTKTYSALQSYLKDTEKLSEPQIDLLLDLLEHETQHHGQLIRYIYGLKLTVPNSWKQRYSLE